jgi:hypothetical protein
MDAIGTLKRVHIRQANGKDLRKLVFDRVKLDTLVNRRKDQP